MLCSFWKCSTLYIVKIVETFKVTHLYCKIDFWWKLFDKITFVWNITQPIIPIQFWYVSATVQGIACSSLKYTLKGISLNNIIRFIFGIIPNHFGIRNIRSGPYDMENLLCKVLRLYSPFSYFLHFVRKSWLPYLLTNPDTTTPFECEMEMETVNRFFWRQWQA